MTRRPSLPYPTVLLTPDTPTFSAHSPTSLLPFPFTPPPTSTPRRAPLQYKIKFEGGVSVGIAIAKISIAIVGEVKLAVKNNKAGFCALTMFGKFLSEYGKSMYKSMLNAYKNPSEPPPLDLSVEKEVLLKRLLEPMMKGRKDGDGNAVKVMTPKQYFKNPDSEGDGYRSEQGYADFIRDGVMTIMDEKLRHWQACARLSSKYEKLMTQPSYADDAQSWVESKPEWTGVRAAALTLAEKLIKECVASRKGNEKYCKTHISDLRGPVEMVTQRKFKELQMWSESGVPKFAKDQSDYKLCELQMESIANKDDWILKHLDPRAMGIALWEDYVAEATRALIVCPAFPTLVWKNQENKDSDDPNVCVEWISTERTGGQKRTEWLRAANGTMYEKELNHNPLLANSRQGNSMLDALRKGMKENAMYHQKHRGLAFRLKPYKNDPLLPMLDSFSNMFQGSDYKKSYSILDPNLVETQIFDFAVRPKDEIAFMKKEIQSSDKFKVGLRHFEPKAQDTIVEASIPYVYKVHANSYDSKLVDSERKRKWVKMEEEEAKKPGANEPQNYNFEKNLNSRYDTSPAVEECNRIYDVLRYMNNLPEEIQKKLESENGETKDSAEWKKTGKSLDSKEMGMRVQLKYDEFLKIMRRSGNLHSTTGMKETALRKATSDESVVPDQAIRTRRIEQVYVPLVVRILTHPTHPHIPTSTALCACDHSNAHSIFAPSTHYLYSSSRMFHYSSGSLVTPPPPRLRLGPLPQPLTSFSRLSFPGLNETPFVTVSYSVEWSQAILKRNLAKRLRATVQLTETPAAPTSRWARSVDAQPTPKTKTALSAFPKKSERVCASRRC
jgi:hypothetical protein